MTVLKLADLAVNKELDEKAMESVVGGSPADMALAGGQNAGQFVSGGFGILSPVVGVNTALNIPVAIDIDTNSLLNINASLANVIGSVGTVAA